MEKIDNLDRKILEIVMRNARIPSKDVAMECGVSRAAIHQRLQRLIDLKVITGSGYHVNPKVLGYRTCTYIGVNLERGAMYRDVVPELEKIPEIVECHFTTGPYTMLIKLYARDNEHLMELLNDRIQMIHGVTGTETHLPRPQHRPGNPHQLRLTIISHIINEGISYSDLPSFLYLRRRFVIFAIITPHIRKLCFHRHSTPHQCLPTEQDMQP